MRVVLLVPRREGFPDRDSIWNYCRPWWQYRFPDWPLIEGHHDEGLFNRAAAVNTAARQAGAWDVAVIIDADVLADPPTVQLAVERAVETGKMVIPFTVRHNLNRPGSARIMAGYQGSWRSMIARDYFDQHSSVVVVPRSLWDAVGGFDEGFRGWGQEDTAFAIACESAAGPRINLPGEVWHLWHSQAPEGKRGTPSANANRARVERYKTAWGDPGAIAAIRSDLDAAPEVGSIPRILHRVVPEHTTQQADDWWAQWASLHPGWQLLTHRDPLDPADWPLTRAAWADCTAGAQLAGLIRLEALWRWGGVYVDQDVEPLRSLDALTGLGGFAAWEDERVIPDAVLAARAGHPAIKRCIELAIKRVKKGPWQSGPGVTTEVLPKADDFVLLPPGSFYPVHYRDPERDAKMRAQQPPWAYGLHHYWGSWLQSKESDDSAGHRLSTAPRRRQRAAQVQP